MSQPRDRVLAGYRQRTGRVLAISALAAQLGSCGTPPAKITLPERTNILLITIDTLRADHLASYGYGRVTSPVLDRLASEGVRFDRTAVQWPKTGPSFASIFTSTYSRDNGIVRKIGIPVPREYSLLAEQLSAHGFTTAAVVSNGAVASEFNFNQGFDRYVETWKVDGDGGDPNRAERVTDEALAVAGQLDPARPFFLWVHYLDPHIPYTPPSQYADRFMDDELFDPTRKVSIDARKKNKQMNGIGRDQVMEGRDDLAFYEARYDAEILYADTEIGRLLEQLETDGQLDETLIVVTSDHGESLGEHSYYFDHGRFGFQTCLRVPLLLHYPGVIKPRVDTQPLELLDLAPTLLELAGLELTDGAWMQGRSLLERLSGASPGDGDHLAFSEAGYGTDGKWQQVVQDERYKLLLVRQEVDQQWYAGKGQRWILYDLVDDPGETRDRSKDLPEELRRLRKELLAWIKAEPFDMGARQASAEEGEMEEETRKQLEALGYLQ